MGDSNELRYLAAATRAPLLSVLPSLPEFFGVGGCVGRGGGDFLVGWLVAVGCTFLSVQHTHSTTVEAICAARAFCSVFVLSSYPQAAQTTQSVVFAWGTRFVLDRVLSCVHRSMPIATANLSGAEAQNDRHLGEVGQYYNPLGCRARPLF